MYDNICLMWLVHYSGGLSIIQVAGSVTQVAWSILQVAWSTVLVAHPSPSFVSGGFYVLVHGLPVYLPRFPTGI